MLKLFVIAGDPSGDTHAANLVLELQKITKVSVFGTGGQKLAKLGQQQYFTVSDLTVIGFDEAIKKIPFLFKVAHTIENAVAKEMPDAIIMVDYPGFNLRLAKRLRKYRIPMIDFIAPQVWVWNYSRVKLLRKYFTKVLCIYPFEADMLKKEEINAIYIGNPVTDSIHIQSKSKEDFIAAYHLMADKPIIGMLPGSRVREVNDLMPIFCKYVKQNADKYQFILGRATSIDKELLSQAIIGHDITIIDDATYDVMAYSDLLWTSSGTATLEAAIIGTPMIIMYKSSKINLWIGLLVSKLRMIGLPNIIAGDKIMPELVSGDITVENLSKITEEMMPYLDRYRKSLIPIQNLLKGKTPIKTAATEIIQSIEDNK